MCGIWAALGKPLPEELAKAYVKRLEGRGPEGTRVVTHDDFQFGFTRLAINGLTEAGMQPMMNELGHLSWICNGEIQNHKELARRFSVAEKSGSDCEVLGDLFQTLGHQTDARTFFRSLDGVFAMVIVDTNTDTAQVARDPQGVRPLFVGQTLSASDELAAGRPVLVDPEGKERVVNRIVFASEMKALPRECVLVEAFPPGHQAAQKLNTLQRIGFEAYHSVPWIKNPALADEESAATCLRVALEAAVEKRMMTERPVAALLSGGLDSSLIAALVQQRLKNSGAPPLKTFSIGFEGSEDLRQARLVAEHIGSEHTEIVKTPQDFLAAIPDVIRDTESYDITTIRASVGNYLVSKEIAKRTDCKVVFNGDGSDEVLGGYMQFQKAPSHEAFEAETERLLNDIHQFDVLRSDRSISSHGLEPRTPFLDKQFVAVAKSIATKLRRPIKGVQCEKQILRTAFEDTGLLPREVLWRRKEAFSDGVSGAESWQQICQRQALEEVGDDWETEAATIQHLTPKTAEAFQYRMLWHRFQGIGTPMERAIVPQHWMPRWSPGATDPSARTLDVYKPYDQSCFA